jgi:hypothetical protein
MQPPTLRFTPTAWAKLVYLRDFGQTEIGGFAISAKDDPLRVEDVRLVRQCCTPFSVQFDDEAVADFFDAQVDQGRKPEQFGRVWAHTHPGDCPMPSGTDEETFARCFGRCDWAVMFILAKEGKTYARLRFNVGPGGSIVIPVAVDFKRGFVGSDHEAWTDEYCSNVVDMDSLRAEVLDERWETTDPTDPSEAPDEFRFAWDDYVDGDGSLPDDERLLQLDDIPY